MLLRMRGGEFLRISDNPLRDFKAPTHSVEFTFMKILTANKITYLEIRPTYYNMGIHHFVKLAFFPGYFLVWVFFFLVFFFFFW